MKFGVDVSSPGVDPHFQSAAVAGFQHGIHGVINDVKKYLLQLMRVGCDRWSRRFKFTLQFKVVYAQIVIAQAKGFVEHLANIDVLLLRLALAGK